MSRCLIKTCVSAALLMCAWVNSQAQAEASCGDHVVWGKTLQAMPQPAGMASHAVASYLADDHSSPAPCPCRGTSCQQAPADPAPVPTPTRIVFERDSLILFESSAWCGLEFSHGALGTPGLAVPQCIASGILRPPQNVA